VSVDGTAQAGRNAHGDQLPPGRTVTIAIRATKQEFKLDVSAGQRVDKNIELQAAELECTSAPLPAGSRRRPGRAHRKSEPLRQRSQKVPAYVTLGITGASAAVGAFFGVKALGAKRFRRDPTTDNADSVERNAPSRTWRSVYHAGRHRHRPQPVRTRSPPRKAAKSLQKAHNVAPTRRRTAAVRPRASSSEPHTRLG
jgi:hypothetical protein